MSRHNTPGTIKIGNTVVQTGGGAYTPGGINTSPAPSAAQATAAAKAKAEEIAKGFPIQTGQEDVIISNVPGFDADDAKAAQMQFQRENQILNNLLIQEQQAKNREGIIRAAQQGQLRKADLTGFEGGLFGFNVGATPSEGISGIRTVRNPFTGEPLAGTTGVAGEALPTQIKAREGLTSEEYNKFIADLYNANPKLFEQTFPLESGKALTPLLLRLIGKDLGSGGVTELVDSTTGAVFTPRGGTVRPSDGSIPTLNGISDPDAGGSSRKDVTEKNMPLFGQVPEQFRQGFIDFYSEYPGPKAGGMAITPVKLPDGSVIEFGDTGTAAIFREYLKSIGVDSNLQNQTFRIVEDTPQPTGITGFDVDKFYASLPQFQQSYSQQGVSPSLLQFLETAQRFPTV